MEDSQIDNNLRLSYYREIGVLNAEHGVFLVRHSETGLPFVKKYIHKDLRPVFEQLQKSRIPGIPSIEDILEDGDRVVVIEEYISGKTLEATLKESGPVSEHKTKEIAIRLCNTLEQLHSLKPPVIHRDIKPSNVILTGNGSVYLIDFNAAKHQDLNESRDTRLLGTTGYAAPEQYGFGPSRVQTDLYGLGILMAELLTGKPDPAACRKNYLGKIVRKAAHVDLNRRYVSAKQMRSALLGKNRKPLWIIIGILAVIVLAVLALRYAIFHLPPEVHNDPAETQESSEVQGTTMLPEVSMIVESLSETETVSPDIAKGSLGDALVFTDEHEFERQLNEGRNLEGSIVTFKVLDFKPDSAFGYNLWAGTHLNFVSDRHPGVNVGDILTVRTKYISSRIGSWIIQYELLDRIPAETAEAETTEGTANE